MPGLLSEAFSMRAFGGIMHVGVPMPTDVSKPPWNVDDRKMNNIEANNADVENELRSEGDVCNEKRDL